MARYCNRCAWPLADATASSRQVVAEAEWLLGCWLRCPSHFGNYHCHRSHHRHVCAHDAAGIYPIRAKVTKMNYKQADGTSAKRTVMRTLPGQEMLRELVFK